MGKKELNMVKGRYGDTFAVQYFRKNAGIMVAVILVGGVMTFVSEYFLTVLNLTNVLRQMTTNILLSYGMTCCLLIGGIDLTVGSVVATTGCILVMLVGSGVPFGAAMLIALLSGALIGGVTGSIINYTDLPPFIVTLAMQKVIRGVGYVVTNGSPVQIINKYFKVLGSGYIWIIPIPVWIVIAITILLVVLLNKTKFGRHVYAMGGNIDAAQFSGVNTKRVRLTVYMISGFCAAVAGVILAARMYSGQPELATGYESDAIAASVLGGVRFTGGCGTIGGVVMGALLIAVLNNGMNLMGFPSYVQTIIQGVIILVAVAIDSLKRQKA